MAEEKAEQSRNLAEVSAKLGATNAERDVIEKSRDAFSSLLLRFAAVTNATEQIENAMETVQQSQLALLREPGTANMNSLSEAYNLLANKNVEAGELVKAVRSHIEGDAQELQSDKAAVAEVVKAATGVADDLARVERGVKSSIASLRRSSFVVFANQRWQPSEVTVEEGEWLCTNATGEWKWAQFQGENKVGPRGTNGVATYRFVEEFGNAALLLRVRGASAVHPYTRALTPVDREGKIEFRINDKEVSDNTGQMEVEIFAFKPFTF